MLKIYPLLALLLISSWSQGQVIQELCSSTTTSGTVVNCVQFGDTLYATGFFDVICGQPTGYIAKWNNNTWEPSHIQLTDPGHALRVINNQLYIARYEESIDSNWVYRYDGSGLQTIGKGIYLTTASGFSELPNIYDVIEYNGNIVACGEFDRVGTDTIEGIMQWDGNAWLPMGSGLTGSINPGSGVRFPHQLLVHNGDLYVAGNFKFAGGVEVNGIAKWDGTQWSALGSGFNNTVYGMAIYNNELVVGGSFTESNGTALNRIAKWDGTDWVGLGFGFTSTGPNDFIFVHTLTPIDGVLYIGGGLKEITYPSNQTEVCNGIVAYSSWGINTFNGGVPNNDIEAICKIGTDQLLVGGGVFGNGYVGLTSLVTHVAEADVPAKVVVSPNPFEAEISISTDQPVERYKIINSVGALVASGSFEPALQVELPSGVYFLQLFHADQSQSVHKVVRR